MLPGKKTYIVGITTILYGAIVQGWYLGNWEAAGQTILVGLGIMGLRKGVASLKA